MSLLANCTMRERDTALIDAARHGRVDDVVALVAGGADVNEPKTDSGARAPCLTATEVVEGSLRTLGDEAINDGATPLLIACQEGHSDIVAKLLAADASVDQADDDGFTPLWVACQERHDEVISKLLAANADVNQATDDGATPLYIASQNGHAEVVAKLLAARQGGPGQR